MLMLTVREGDYITIGDDIKVYLMKGEWKSVIGIEAPKNIPILRQTVYDRTNEITPDKKIQSVEDL